MHYSIIIIIPSFQHAVGVVQVRQSVARVERIHDDAAAPVARVLRTRPRFLLQSPPVAPRADQRVDVSLVGPMMSRSRAQVVRPPLVTRSRVQLSARRLVRLNHIRLDRRRRHTCSAVYNDAAALPSFSISSVPLTYSWFTPPRQTRQDCLVCVASASAV